MSVLFDLKNMPMEWADRVNESLRKDWSSYFSKYGSVGAEIWWNNYELGHIANSRLVGVVLFVGMRTDSFNEEWATVELDHDGELIEYDQLGYWESEEVVAGAEVVVEPFQITIQQKYGPMIFNFERLVQVV